MYACLDSDFCISNKLLHDGDGAGRWVTLMSRRDLKDKVQTHISIHWPRWFRSLPVSNPWPAIPSLVPCHPSLQVHCKSWIWVLQTAWAVFPSYVLLCIYAFILLFLLKRTSFSRCHCDKCLPDVVQFSTTGSFLFAHRAPWTDSCF